MKKISIVVIVAILSSGCASSFLQQVSRVTKQDLHDTLVSSTDASVKDDDMTMCVIWIGNQQPNIDRVLNLPVSGILSKAAKRRAVEMLFVKLRPSFNRACAPVMADERQRFVRFAALFGR